jgi:SAM-dependent methyltransferase
MSTPNAAAATEDFEFAALAEARNYRRAIVAEFAPFLRGRVLEVGAGIGQTSEAILALTQVDELVGIEPDPRFHPGFRQRLPAVRLIEGTTATLAHDEHFHAAVLVNVLEHIEDDQAELARLKHLLAPSSGHLCLLVPARQEIYSKLDAHFGHFRRYARARLHAQLQQAGFTPHRVAYFNFIGYFAWALRFRLLGSMTFDPAQVRLFDQRIFPWMHALESKLCRPPIGQSVLAIAQA